MPRNSLRTAVLRHGWWLVSVFASLLALRLNRTNDWQLLRLAARDLTGTSGLHLYAHTPGLQVGAPALLLVRLLDAVGSLALVHVVLALSLVGVLMLAERTAAELGRPVRRGTALGTGALAAVGWTSLAGDWLHVEDAAALLCLAAALLLLLRAGPVTAAALIGLAVAVKPWAVLGVPLLLAIPRAAWPRALTALVTVPAVCWLPFLVADPNTTRVTHTPFPVKTGTPVHLLHLATGTAPGWLRTLQLLVAVGIASLVWFRRRGTPGDVVAAGVAARLLLDVADYPYYWAGLVLAAAYADVAAARRPWRTTLALVGWSLSWLGVSGAALASARLAVLLGLLLTYAWPRPRPSDTAAPMACPALPETGRLRSVSVPRPRNK